MNHGTLPAQGPVDVNVGRHATNEDDVLDVQNAVRLLQMIANGWAYSKDCDLGDPHRKATIRDASKYARLALQRLEPCYHRMLEGIPR
jgi:hypothetical protein